MGIVARLIAPIAAVAAIALAPGALEGQKKRPAPRMIAMADIWFESPGGKQPWKTMTIESVRFGGKRAKVGEKVSAIPLDPELPPVILTIRGIKDLEWAPKVRELALSSPTNKIWRDADARGGDNDDVLIVYPPAPGAKFLSGDMIRKSTPARRLPRGFTKSHVEWGVDVTGDGRPDALMLRFCSEDRRKPECFEATSHVVYRRRGRRWQRVFVYEPVS